MKKLFLCILFIILSISGCSSNKDILTLNGDIQNNIVSANSTATGKIIAMNKELGEPVKKGEIIAVIDNTNQKYAVEQLQAVVRIKQAKLEELQAGTRPEQIEQAQSNVNAAKAQFDLLNSGNRNEQIEQAKNAVLIAQESLDSVNSTHDFVNNQYINALKLYKEGALSKNELDNLKLQLDTTSKQLSSAQYQFEISQQQLTLLQSGSTLEAINIAKANYDSANAQLKLLKNGPTTQTILAAQADLDQSIAQLNQAQNILNNHNITALEDGIIISKNFNLGDIVNTGNNIVDIAISNDLYVLCYLPDKYLDKIFYNQQLNVITSISNLTGSVSYIDLNHEYTPKDKKSTSNDNHIATKIKISILDTSGVLKSGMKASVEIPIK